MRIANYVKLDPKTEMDSFAQVSPARLHSRSSTTIRQELSDLLERQLHLRPPPNKATTQQIVECINPNVTPPVPPKVPPRPPHLRKHNLTRQMSETNRQLLKEMIEKNRTRRRLSNPGTKENRASIAAPSSSPSLIVENLHTRPPSLVVQTLQTESAAAGGLEGRCRDVVASSGDLTRIQMQDVSIRETTNWSPIPQLEIQSSTTLAPEVMPPEQNYAPTDTISAAAADTHVDHMDLIDLTSETNANPTSTVEDTEVGQLLSTEERTAAENHTETSSRTIKPTKPSGSRFPDIAASSQSLDSFLQSTSAPVSTNTSSGISQDAPTTSRSSTSLTSNVSYDDSPGELRVSNKVVWFTPHGTPETGTVKWIGKLKNRYYAGVEFERAVGNSSGLYHGQKLFNCALTRGRFVPVSELILHIDFYSGSCSNEPSPYSCGIPTDDLACDSDSRKIGEPPIVCVICQDSLIISASIDDDEDDKIMAARAVSKNIKKNLSKSMDELSTRDKVRIQPTPPRHETTNNKEMVATRCGHLFHSDCLSQWFSLKRRLHQPCPYCQHVMHVQDTIRIYPVQGTL